MSDRDWQEEQRIALGRLLDSVFRRREASEEKLGDDIHWLGTVNKNLEAIEPVPQPTRNIADIKA
jgi:hypothetical protein